MGQAATAALFEVGGWPSSKGTRRAGPPEPTQPPLLAFSRARELPMPQMSEQWAPSQQQPPKREARRGVATVLLFAPAEDLGAIRKARNALTDRSCLSFIYHFSLAPPSHGRARRPHLHLHLHDCAMAPIQRRRGWSAASMSSAPQGHQARGGRPAARASHLAEGSSRLRSQPPSRRRRSPLRAEMHRCQLPTPARLPATAARG